MRALGADAAGKLGWVGIVVDDTGFVAAGAGSLDSLVAWSEPVAAVGVDIPLGSIPGGRRRADVEARRFIGARGSSVFAAPPAGVLDLPGYAEANEWLAATGATRLSRQAWALVPKMREAAMLASTDTRLAEVHPEVSFRAMLGEPLPWSKKSWNGFLLRRRLLAEAGIVVPDPLPGLSGAVADDVVDAAAVAWSARRLAAGEARPLPDPPEDGDGRAVAIWY